MQKFIISPFAQTCWNWYRQLKTETNLNFNLYFFLKTKYLNKAIYLLTLRFDLLVLTNLNLLNFNTFRYNYKTESKAKVFYNNNFSFIIFQIISNLKT